MDLEDIKSRLLNHCRTTLPHLDDDDVIRYVEPDEDREEGGEVEDPGPDTVIPAQEDPLAGLRPYDPPPQV